MTTTATKISWPRIAILVAVVVGLCVLSCAALALLRKPLGALLGKWVWKTDPAITAQTGGEILDYELPPGYQELMAMSVQNMRTVVIGPQDGSERMLIQLQEGPIVDSDPTYQSDLQILWAKQVGMHRYNTEPQGTHEVLLRGQSYTLFVRQGQEEDSGRPVRQWLGLLDGKNGLVLLVIVGEPDNWDQALAEGFIQSIR